MDREIERISLTIDRSVLARVDKLIDGNEIKNRSHAIEVLLSRALGDSCPRTAIILCGGKGTRFRPITYEIPKALMPVQGRTLTEHLLDLFKKYNVKNVYLSVGYLKERIKAQFADGSKAGINIKYIEEDEALGTAGPLRLTKSKINGAVIVSNGDELKDVDLEKMFRVHKQNKALVTIALTTVSNPSAYGVAMLDGSKIMEFVEKPKDSKSNLINAGLYIIEPEVFEMIPKGFAMLEKDVFPKIAKMGRLYGFPFSGQWFDTGTPERYEKAIKNWKGIK